MEFKNENDEANEMTDQLIDMSRFASKMVNINTAPDVDVSALVNKKEMDIVQKFESGYYIPNKQNHLTGYINYHTMNDFNFNEQMYTYNAYGFAQDPTDFANDKVI